MTLPIWEGFFIYFPIQNPNRWIQNLYDNAQTKIKPEAMGRISSITQNIEVDIHYHLI